MAGAVVQVKEAANNASATTLASGALASDVTAGNFLYIVANAGTDITITPSKNSGTATIGTITSLGSAVEAGVLDELEHFWCEVTGSGSLDILITYGSSTDRRGVLVVEVSGVSGVDVDDETTETGNNPTTNSSVSVTAQPAFGLSFGCFYQGGTPGAGSGWSASGGTRWSGIANSLLQTRTISATGTLTANFVNAAVDRNNAVMVVFTDTPTPVDQQAFRFRNDDGSETTATWAGAQDEDITHPLATNLRLRFLLQATGDAPAFAPLLRFKKAADTIWRPVEVDGSGSLATGTAGTVSAGGTTSISVAYPAAVARGDLVIMVVCNRPNANTPNDISGWTKFSSTGGAGSEGAGTGTIRITIYIKTDADGRYEADGTESGSVTVSCTSGTSMFGRMVKYLKTTGREWTIPNPVFGADSSAGTSWSATASSNPVVDAGDILFCASAVSEDTARAASEAATATGATFGTMTEIQDSGITTGNDLGMVIADFLVSTGPSSAAPVFTMTMSGTNAANSAGVTAFIRIRQTDAPIVLALSANITAGGEATTQQLSGGTDAFVTGRMWDNENGTDTVDLTADDYTEVEWCILAQAPAVDTDVFHLRVYKGTVVLDAYTVAQAEWTIGEAGGTSNAAAVPAAGVATTGATAESHADAAAVPAAGAASTGATAESHADAAAVPAAGAASTGATAESHADAAAVPAAGAASTGATAESHADAAAVPAAGAASTGATAESHADAAAVPAAGAASTGATAESHADAAAVPAAGAAAAAAGGRSTAQAVPVPAAGVATTGATSSGASNAAAVPAAGAASTGATAESHADAAAVPAAGAASTGATAESHADAAAVPAAGAASTGATAESHADAAAVPAAGAAAAAAGGRSTAQAAAVPAAGVAVVGATGGQATQFEEVTASIVVPVEWRRILIKAEPRRIIVAGEIRRFKVA